MDGNPKYPVCGYFVPRALFGHSGPVGEWKLRRMVNSGATAFTLWTQSLGLPMGILGMQSCIIYKYIKTYTCIHVYVSVYIHIYVCVYIYIYMYNRSLPMIHRCSVLKSPLQNLKETATFPAQGSRFPNFQMFSPKATDSKFKISKFSAPRL